MTEPVITINGTRLSEGQAMAVRVAVTNFHMRLTNKNYQRDLGPVAAAYMARVREIVQLMLESKTET